MTLLEKIEYEYRCFFLDQMRTSKENIFAHSKEIERKKQLKEELLRFVPSVDEVTTETLLVQENLLESAYLFVQDGEAGCIADTTGNIVSLWLERLLAAAE